MLLPFIDSCQFNHLVQSRIPLRAFFSAFVSRIRLLFHSGLHGINLSRDLFPLAWRLLYFSTYRASTARLLPRLLLQAGFLSCHTTLCFAIFHASRSWHVLKLQFSLSLFTVSPAWERSTRVATSPNGHNHSSVSRPHSSFSLATRPSAWENNTNTKSRHGAWPPRRKRPRPAVPMNIIHQGIHRRQHQHRVRVQVYLPSPILPTPCSLALSVCLVQDRGHRCHHARSRCVHSPKGLEIASAIVIFAA